MRNIYLISIFFLSISSSLFSQKATYLWPIKNKNAGNGILYKPQDYIDNEHNYDNLFITSNIGDTVVAPQSGIIKSFVYIYQKSLIYMNSFRHIYNDSLSVTDFDITFRNTLAKELKIDSKYISISIGIQTKKGEMYYISGLRPIELFKTGSKINKGQVIGFVGYSYKKIDKPTIHFSRSIKQKSADPMSIFGLQSTFVSKKINTVDYLHDLHSADKLKKDFIIFRKSLEEGHSGLYDYIQKNELDKLFDQTYNNITKPMTSESFRVLLLPILKAVRDSHTALYSSKYKLTDKSNLPIRFGMYNDSLIVFSTTHNFKEYLHKKIETINNEKIENIILKIKKILYGSDGFVKSHDARMLLLHFNHFYKTINRLNKGDKIIIQFTDGTKKKFLYDFYQKKSFYPKIKKTDDKRFSINLITKKIGLVDINTFNLLDTDIDSIEQFISNQNLEHLIFDVRDNLGGDTKAIQKIFSLIAKEPFKVTSYEKVNKKGHFDLFDNSLNYSTESQLFENYKKIDGKKGYYLTGNNFAQTEPNKNHHYDKKVYVLINEFSKSAATIFPALIYKYKRGKIIGRETGSSYYQLNATVFPIIYLKNSGLELYMPLVKSVFDTKGNSDIPWGCGVLPTKKVAISFKDFTGNEDPILKETLKIINKNNNTQKSFITTTYFTIGFILILILVLLGIIFIKKTKKSNTTANTLYKQ